MTELIDYGEFATEGLKSCQDMLVEMIGEARDQETRNGLFLEMGKIAYQLVIRKPGESTEIPGVQGQPSQEIH